LPAEVSAGGGWSSPEFSLRSSPGAAGNPNIESTGVGIRLAAYALPQPIILTGIDSATVADGDVVSYITLADSASLTVTGGRVLDLLEINGEDLSVRNVDADSDATVDISGGTFEGDVKLTNGGTTTISGGIFEEQVSFGVETEHTAISGGTFRDELGIGSATFEVTGGYFANGFNPGGSAIGIVSGFYVEQPFRITARGASSTRMIGGFTSNLSVLDGAVFTYAGGTIRDFVNLNGPTSTLIVEGVAFYQHGAPIDFAGATELRFDTSDEFFTFTPGTGGSPDQFRADAVAVTFGPGLGAGSFKAFANVGWGGEVVLRLADPAARADFNGDGLLDFFDVVDFLEVLDMSTP